jgi:hypothetical protein
VERSFAESWLRAGRERVGGGRPVKGISRIALVGISRQRGQKLGDNGSGILSGLDFGTPISNEGVRKEMRELDTAASPLLNALTASFAV